MNPVRTTYHIWRITDHDPIMDKETDSPLSFDSREDADEYYGKLKNNEDYTIVETNTPIPESEK